jgi:transketolase
MMLGNVTENDLQKKAQWVRSKILEMISCAKKGHIGGSFSCVEILVALFYGQILRFDPKDPHWPERDRFILSKGHSAATLYAILADLGYFDSGELCRYQEKTGILSGHPYRGIPGIECDTGSLGHGLGIGVGLALSAQLDKKDFRTVVLLGDGECHEGSVWEAAMFAAHHKLGNLTGIIDCNGICSTDFLRQCVGLEPLEDKWKAFGWDVNVVNGHSFPGLLSILAGIRSRKSDRPFLVIAQTVKGKGVSFMENNPDWHHKVPHEEQLKLAREELERWRREC